MQTKILDFIISSSCVLLLICCSAYTSYALTTESVYGIVIYVLVFLLSYGLYTTLLLKVMHSIWPYPSGQISMDSFEFTYWKLNAVLVDLAWKSLSPFKTVFTEPLFYAAFGARIGKQIAIGGILRDPPPNINRKSRNNWTELRYRWPCYYSQYG